MRGKENRESEHTEQKGKPFPDRTKSVGLLSMVLTSLCCLGPILLLALGLGSTVLTMSLVKNKWLFMGIGASLLAVSYYSYFRERKRCTTSGCNVTGRRVKKVFLGITTGVVLFFVSFSFYPYSVGITASTGNGALLAASTNILPTVYYFWEPCPTCTVTNPTMRKLQKKYKGQANFRWVNLISDDDAYPLARKYEIQAIPWLVYADSEGVIKGQLEGWFTFKKAERHLLGIISNGAEDRKNSGTSG